jgi:ATP-dependent DNA helicase DinG
MDNLRNDRLLFHDSSNRSQVLELFKSSKAPLIIVSPSMDRGIDFKYDLCSFIIIVKIPYLDLSDKQISTRVYSSKYGQLWYAWSTACSIIQMSGRATRAEDDFSETFILDKQFSKFYSQYHKFFPQWWKESLQYIDLEE